jgi:hypothetical protein
LAGKKEGPQEGEASQQMQQFQEQRVFHARVEDFSRWRATWMRADDFELSACFELP